MSDPPAYQNTPPPKQNPGYSPAAPNMGGPPPPQQPGYYPGPSNVSFQHQQGYHQVPTHPPPQQQCSNATVVVNQPVTAVQCVRYGPDPVSVQCPYCNNRVTTYLEYHPGLMAWLIVGLLFLFGFWLCFFIPLLIDGFKDVEHNCPVCKNRLGTYQRLG